MRRRLNTNCTASRRSNLLTVLVAVLLVALVLSNVAWIILEQRRENADRTIIFQTRYNFSHTAYSINQLVYVGSKADPTVFTWPGQKETGWSPAGDAGYYEWHMQIPASTTQVKCVFNIAFLPSATENAWGTTLDSGSIDLQDMPSEGTVYHVVLLLFY